MQIKAGVLLMYSVKISTYRTCHVEWCAFFVLAAAPITAVCF